MPPLSASANNNILILNSSWQIIPAKVSDIPVIIHLASIIWPVTYAEILLGAQISYMLNLMYSQKKLELQMSQDKQYFYLVKQAKETIGFAGIGPLTFNATYLKNKAILNPWKLNKLYVLPHYKGTGIGKALLHQCLAQAHFKNADYLVLNVNRNNNAIQFYQKNGFEILAAEDFNIGNGFFMNDFIMGRPVF